MSFAQRPDLVEDDPGLPTSLHIPAAILLAAIWAAWLWHLGEGQSDWGVSGAAMAQGRYENLVLHMFAHAGLVHIGFNSAVLFSLAGPMLSWMGAFPGNWLRFFALYFLSGLAGAGLFLLFNPDGIVPMVGASGAISGLIGLVSRLSPGNRALIPLFSRSMFRRVWDFTKANLVLILLFTVPIFLMGGSGGIAWEAHLGGFLVGILGAPLVLIDAKRVEPLHD